MNLYYDVFNREAASLIPLILFISLGEDVVFIPGKIISFLPLLFSSPKKFLNFPFCYNFNSAFCDFENHHYFNISLTIIRFRIKIYKVCPSIW